MKLEGQTAVDYVPVNVKKKSVHEIFNQGPKEKTKQPVGGCCRDISQSSKSNKTSIGDWRKPEQRNHIPRGLAQGLQEVPK